MIIDPIPPEPTLTERHPLASLVIPGAHATNVTTLEGVVAEASGRSLVWLFSKIDWASSCLKTMSGASRTTAVGLTNRLIGLYAASLEERGGAIRHALRSGDGLLAAVTPHLSPITEFTFDDADLLFAAAMGVRSSAYKSGIGNKYYPTPLRHLRRALQILELTSSDIVVDPGCGVGVTIVAGTHLSPATFVGLEGFEPLAADGSRAAAEFSAGGRGSVLHRDFLRDPFPDVTKVFLYEPVSGEDSNKLVKVLAASAAIEVCCYVPHGDRLRTVADAIRDAKEFVPARQTPENDIIIFSRI